MATRFTRSPSGSIGILIPFAPASDCLTGRSRASKLKVKRAVSYVSDFESAVAREAKRRGVLGVVCDHIHHAEIRKIDGILYANDGDWVESATALAEHADGTLEILYWRQALPVEPRATHSSTLPELEPA